MDQQLVFGLVACAIMLLLGFPVHEYMHAYAAYRLGDSTARYRGRLTLNPLVHFDQVGGILLLASAVLTNGAAFFGFAKPTPVNPMNLRGGRHGEAVVAAAGPLSNLVMGAIVAIPLRLVDGSPDLVQQIGTSAPLGAVYDIAVFFVLINVFLFIFNLLPLPPLDGFSVLVGIVDPRTAWQLRQFVQQYGQYIPIVFLLFIFLLAPRILGPLGSGLYSFLVGSGPALFRVTF